MIRTTRIYHSYQNYDIRENLASGATGDAYGQITPGTPALDQVQDGLEDAAAIGGRTAQFGGLGQQGLEIGPLGVGQVGVVSGFFHRPTGATANDSRKSKQADQVFCAFIWPSDSAKTPPISFFRRTLSDIGWVKTDTIGGWTYYITLSESATTGYSNYQTNLLSGSDGTPNTNTYPPAVSQVAGNVSFTIGDGSQTETIIQNPPPTNGTGTTTITLSQEYTTCLLKAKAMADLDMIALQDTNMIDGNRANALSSLSYDEKTVQLAKERYQFTSPYKLVKNTKYRVWTGYYVTCDTGYANQFWYDKTVTGTGDYYTETRDLVPSLKGCSFEFTDSGTPFDFVEQGHSTTVKLTAVKVEPDTGCGCSSESTPVPGGGGPRMGSIEHYMSLGVGEFGYSVGDLRFISETPTATLSTPQDLELSAITNLVTVIYDSNGWIRQVGSSQCLADIGVATPYRYFVNFYSTNAFSPSNDGLTLMSTNGLVPMVTWTISNPDGAAGTNRLQITETRGALSITNTFTWNTNLQTLIFDSGNGLRRETLAKQWSTDGSQRTEIRQTVDPVSGGLLAQTKSVYQHFTWGEALITVVQGSGSDLLTNTYTYWDDGTNSLKTGKIEQEVHGDGSWKFYDYDSVGRLYHTKSGIADATPDSASPVDDTYYYYDSYFSQDDPSCFGNEPRLVYETQGDLGVQKYFYATNNMTVQIDGTTIPICTTNTYYPIGDANSNMLASTEHSDGTMEIYLYGNDPNFKTNTVFSGAPNSAHNTIIDGTRTVTVRGNVGQILSQTVYDINPSRGDILVAQDNYQYMDSLNRSYVVTHLDGTSNSVQYSCCGISSEVDRDGVVTMYGYDALKRRISQSRFVNGFTNAPLENYYSYDSIGNLLSSTRVGTDSSSFVSSGSVYDVLGRLVRDTNSLGGVTSYSYALTSDGHRIMTVTYPDMGQRIELYNRDGSLQRVIGNAVFPKAYAYSGATTTTSNLDQSYNPTGEWEQHVVDEHGRTDKTIYPSGESDTIYDASNHLWMVYDGDYVRNTFAYDSRGRLTTTAIRGDDYMLADNSIDYAGSDRISKTVSDVIYDAVLGTAVNRSQTFVWDVYGVDSSNLVSTVERSVDGLKALQITWNGPIGMTNTSQTVYGANGDRWETNTAPDGSRFVSRYSYGRLISAVRFTSDGTQVSGTTNTYDAFGRKSSVIDTRNGATTYAYNHADLPICIITPSPAAGLPGQTNQTAYDSSLRAVQMTQPDGTFVTNVYYPNGLVELTWGSRTYPVGYAYDSQGRMSYMTNWSSYSASTPAGARVTAWAYDENGNLTNKLYDGNMFGFSYQYTAGRRLLDRIDADGSETYYGHNAEGDVATVWHYDYTGDVETYFDRRGRVCAVTNLLVNQYGWAGYDDTEYAYDEAGNSLSETHGAGILAGTAITNSYDSLSRRTNVSVYAGNTLVSTASYAYDGASRLAAVSDGTNSAVYTHVANSSLVGQIVFANNGVTRMTTTKAYDNLNRLMQISSAPSGAYSMQQTFNYNYNPANQRTKDTLADGSYWVYGYDSLGQVTNGCKYFVDGTPVAGQQFDYAFDTIGNRTQTQTGGDAAGANLRVANYYANNLNQLTNRDVVPYVDIKGASILTNAVTVNGQTAYRKEEYFRKELGANNINGALWTNIVVSGGQSVTGNVYVPQQPETFQYDAAGNLTNDGRWAYVWDGENRLIQMTVNTNVGPQYQLTFVYDYQGRRIQKVVATSDGSAYIPQSTNIFVYDGWNLVAVLAPASSLLSSYAWGSDLSGSAQGAGGVGGLLWSKFYTNSTLQNCNFYAYDGNGNVAALVSAADGTTAANYEYGPFGEVIRATGPMAKLNPFRFSTKYQDDETDFLYYGYRYYNPSTGRWIGRDPSEENGGPNLYVFAANNPINDIDILGLDNDAGPWTVGWQWLTGSGPGTQNFGQNDPFTLKLEQHQHIQDLLKQLDQQLAQQCANCVTTGPNGQDNYSLSGTKGIVLYVKDYSTLLTFGLTGNIAVTYLGSYALTYQVRSVSCKNGTANVHIHVVNVSSISSATHPPIIGYTQWWDNYIGQELNSLFSSGAMSPKTQIFDWDEPLKFKGNPCCTK